MKDHEMRSDVEEAAYQAWDRQHRARKRRMALLLAVALAVGFAGATVAGRSHRTQAQHAANAL